MNQPAANGQLPGEGQAVAPPTDPGAIIDTQTSNPVMPVVLPTPTPVLEEEKPPVVTTSEVDSKEDTISQETPGLAQPGQVEAVPVPTEVPITTPVEAPVEALPVVAAAPPAEFQPPANPESAARELLDADPKNPGDIADKLSAFAYDEKPPAALTPEQITPKI